MEQNSCWVYFHTFIAHLLTLHLTVPSCLYSSHVIKKKYIYFLYNTQVIFTTSFISFKHFTSPPSTNFPSQWPLWLPVQQALFSCCVLLWALHMLLMLFYIDVFLMPQFLGFHVFGLMSDTGVFLEKC